MQIELLMIDFENTTELDDEQVILDEIEVEITPETEIEVEITLDEVLIKHCLLDLV